MYVGVEVKRTTHGSCSKERTMLAIINNVEYELYEGMTPKYLLLFDFIVIRYCPSGEDTRGHS